ncbi:ABC-2 type transport system permease protein [Chitinophaga jiangningensis]|uniref:ABC-2 type transport system permease protein n=1 Tax=Chitinophaga jiangningensis TaxID=1419482 RepID=A0A1M6ZZT9_9BACT|nr:ABC transporter permease subunit [Chitinophaga jiangningensis]SHL35869.1 ABC-2 type transport system permease protein [Chitinophaga jiangningensis]
MSVFIDKLFSVPESPTPFRTMVRKEVGDHIRSWRFITMLLLIVLTFVGAMYISLANIRKVVMEVNDPDHLYVYLKLLTTAGNAMPAFHIFISFLGPLLGIALGFDAVNSEQNSGTLMRLLAQPVYRDNILLAKFYAALLVVSTLFLSLVLLMIGGGLLITGAPVEATELLRILAFVAISVIYVGFWLSLAICLSVKFRHAATSALTAIGIWLFFTVFYQMIVNMVMAAILPDPAYLDPQQVNAFNNLILSLMRVAPSQLYTDAATTLLMPSIRSLGPLSMEQMAGAIPAPLSFMDSLMIVWPQVTGLIAATMACFALTYYLFMRKEIRH